MLSTRKLGFWLRCVFLITLVGSSVALIQVYWPKACAAAGDEDGGQPAQQPGEPRQIKRLVVWKVTREENAMAVPAPDAGSWQQLLRIAGHCNEMLSADIKIYVEVTPPDRDMKEVLWRVREMEPDSYTARPNSGTFAAGNPVTCRLHSGAYADPSSTVHYWVEVGFDEDGNGTLRDHIDDPQNPESQHWIPIHFVSHDEYVNAVFDAQATLAFFLLPPPALAAYDNMCLFLGYSNPTPMATPTYNCDLRLSIIDETLPVPQWHVRGGVYMRGCGVTSVPNPVPANAIPKVGETFTMPLYGYASDSNHRKAIHNSRDDMGPAIFSGTILPKADAIATILANSGDGLYSITSRLLKKSPFLPFWIDAYAPVR